MIEFKNVAVRYGTQVVLEHVNFRICKGDRVGIVGPNGSGKSTLFRLILDETYPDEGDVVIEESPGIGHMRQYLHVASDTETLLQYALRGISAVMDLEKTLHQIENDLTAEKDPAARERLLKRMGDVQTEFEHLGGYEMETRVKASLSGLGFPVEEFDKPFKSFSGGWQMRAELARVLASHPDLLLLDEPSNYLDLPAVEWLRRFLRGFDGTLVLISHDRYLLRSLTRITVEVDAHTATRYNGDLDFYLKEREIRYANLVAAKENQNRRLEQLERFVDRFKATATKASQAQSRIKMIEKIESEAIVLPKRGLAAGYLRLPEAPHSGSEMARLEHVDFSYDGKRDVLRDVNLSILRGSKTAIIGFNGMGKTTLLRILAGVRQPTGGTFTLGHKVLPGYLSQEFAETIPPEISVFECAKRSRPNSTEKELRSILASFGFSADDIVKQTGVLSGGEKIRLAFLRLFLDPPNLMLLDEPTTHLDLEGRAALEKEINAYKGTVCLVSHDIEFVRNTVSSIIEISPKGVRMFSGGFDYYLEKSQELVKRELENAGSSSEKTSEAPKKEQDLTSKELRRLRARERAQRQPWVNALKKKVTVAENKITELEAELESLSAVLFNPAPNTDFAETNKRLKYVQDQLDFYTEEWERDATELDRIQHEE